MSREIDPENLTEDDLEYINQRPMLRQEFIMQGYGDPLEGYTPKTIHGGEPETPVAVYSEPGESGTEPVSEPVGEEETEGDDYDSWKKAELEAEVEKRGLDASGNKADLIAALREDDAEEE